MLNKLLNNINIDWLIGWNMEIYSLIKLDCDDLNVSVSTNGYSQYFIQLIKFQHLKILIYNFSPYSLLIK